MKRQSLFFFGWLLLVTPVALQAQFNYTVTNQTVTITGYTGTNSVVVIPSTINGLPVTSIGTEAFAGTSIANVTIPNSVTSIGDEAFVLCSNLTSVTIGSGVTSVGYQAFSGCYSLITISLPTTLTNVGERAFGGCSHLTGITIPSSVTSIGSLAFVGCTSLTGITIGSGVTSIGYEAFYYCLSLKAIMVDGSNLAYSSLDGVLLDRGQTTLIQYPPGKPGDYAVPNSVESIGDEAFYYCPSLTSVTIPNTVTNIGSSAFYGCTSLTSVTIGSGVTRIGDEAFHGCMSLTSVTIPDSVTSIGPFAFRDCSILTNIVVDPLNSVFSSVDGVLFDKSQTTLLQYLGGKVGAYTIPNGVTSIGDYAFALFTNLTSVTIPNSVTTIGVYAFLDCSLTSLYFAGNAPSVARSGFGAFSDDNAIAYYLPGTEGWEQTFGDSSIDSRPSGIPTAVWTLPYPLILNGSLGVLSNQFGFTVSWATNLNVVVEAATDLANPFWFPLATNALSGGIFYFSDPQWKNYPSRFYRVRSQ